MKVKLEIEANVPNTIYCGECCHNTAGGNLYRYCDVFRSVLCKANDRPQMVKCEKCLLATARQAREAPNA